MSKLKTRKTLARRIKITATGKLLRERCGTGHLKTKKSRKHKRRLKKIVSVSPHTVKNLKQLLPGKI